MNKRQEMESRGEIFLGNKVPFSLLCGVPKGVGMEGEPIKCNSTIFLAANKQLYICLPVTPFS